MKTGNFTGFEVSLEKPGIAWIEFNEPEKLNGMNARKKRDLIETLTQAQMDNAVRVIVFIGQGRGFCAGDDLSAYASSKTDENALMPPIPMFQTSNPPKPQGWKSRQFLRATRKCRPHHEIYTTW